MNQALVSALKTPDVARRLSDLGVVVVANTPEEFRDVIKADVERYQKVMLESNIERM